ncbi:MAG: efflux transporter outer membrane subunit [Alphaproteobacteria bacterium]|nr:efflux transporter outer membrane subunit [Alphaproteobacteria bacterium]
MLLAGGCVRLGPDFEKPEADVSAAFTETADDKIKAEPGDYGQWWASFNDPVLNSLVDSARGQNLDLQAAGVRILEARAVLGIATGNQYPQTQQATGNILGTKIGGETPVVPRARFTEFRAGFDAAWELDFWGRFARGIESADAGLRASIADYDDLLVSLTAEVASTYTQIREFEERIRLARRNVQIQARTLKLAVDRFRGGAVTELDVTQARSNLRTTQALVPQLQISLRQSQNALSVLLGQPPSELRDVLGGESRPIPAAPPEVAVGIPAELLRRRPDIRRAELDAATQSARIGVARADLFPRFQLVGSIGFEADQTTDWFTGRAFNGFGGPAVSWNILNYGRITNNVRAQDARYQELIVNYQNTVLEAAQEVEDGLAGFVRSQQQAKFLAGAVQALNRSVELSLQQYTVGVVDFQRVLDTQEDLVQRQDNLAETRSNVALNLIATYKALGGGWQIRGDTGFVNGKYVDAMRERTDWGKLLGTEAPKAQEAPEPDPGYRAPDW